MVFMASGEKTAVSKQANMLANVKEVRSELNPGIRVSHLEDGCPVVALVRQLAPPPLPFSLEATVTTN